jgi:N-acetylglucosaminyl-diphospho-decaprenol L-rhamnosyltransferase
LAVPELSIIIVNWNGEKFLPNCLRSVAAFPPSVSYEVVVIDNCSSDKSVEWLNSAEAADLFPNRNYRVIESSKNLGFGPANNLVIDQTHSEFILLLNPDTVVRSGAIDRLLRTINSSSKVGLVVPKLINDDGSLQFNVWDRPPTPVKILVEGLRLWPLVPRILRARWLFGRHFDYSTRKSVPAASGAVMLARRAMINEVGAFDPGIFMYGEDVEWCFRVRRNGWEIHFEPEALVVHLGGRSTAQEWSVSASRLREQEAMLQFQLKYLSRARVVANSLSRSFVLSLSHLKMRIQGKRADEIDTLIKLHLSYCKKAIDIKKVNRQY